MNPRIIYLEHQQDNMLVDAISVTLQDPTGSYGIREVVSQLVVVPAGAATTHVGIGEYEYDIDSLNNQLAYEFFFKVIDQAGGVQYVYGTIPIVVSTFIGTEVGQQIPADKIGTGIPFYDKYGVQDGYVYALAEDGYYRFYDFNNDELIDEIHPLHTHLRGIYPHGGYFEGPPSQQYLIESGNESTYYRGEFDPRGVRIGLGGSREGGLPPEHGPEVPSPKGAPALDGTFGGTLGYSGLSGEVPATGGARTNRGAASGSNGTGYWDGISFEKLCVIPIGPRGQCVIGDTLVDGEFGAIKIKDVIVGDSLKVYNRTTQKFEYQKVTKVHINNTKTGKLYKIKTQNGRELTCTAQHPFIVRNSQDHVHAEKLSVGMQLVVEPLAFSDLHNTNYAKVLDREIVTTNLSKIYNATQIQAALSDLESRNLLNLDSMNLNSYKLARLIGHMFGDGSLPKYFNTNGLHRLGMVISTGHSEEILAVKAEIESLGFNVSDEHTQEAQSKIAKGISRSVSCRQAALAELLYVLGVPLGNKTTQEYDIPQWIFNHRGFLREFLAAYYGSEGTNPITHKNTLNYLSVSFNKIECLDGLRYANQLIAAFAQFGIAMRLLEQPGVQRQDGHTTKQYMLIRDGDSAQRSLSRAALMTFVANIGVRYSNLKQQDFRMMSEYQRYIAQSISSKQAIFDEVKALQKQGPGLAEICKKFDTTSRYTIESWLYKRSEGIELRVSRDEPSFEEWIETYTNGNEIYDQIVAIESFESNENVYDVTMETLFDFVTNGIVTLDCLKDKANAYVRVLLKDTDPTCQAFNDDEVDMYLEGSLWAFNAKPTFTAFLWDHMQDRWLSVISQGAAVFALYADSLIEAGREFTITDNGISYTPPPVSDKMQAYASALLQHYDARLTEIKANFKPLPGAVGIFSVLDISPSLTRLRHLREKRIF